MKTYKLFFSTIEDSNSNFSADTSFADFIEPVFKTKMEARNFANKYKKGDFLDCIHKTTELGWIDILTMDEDNEEIDCTCIKSWKF